MISPYKSERKRFRFNYTTDDLSMVAIVLREIRWEFMFTIFDNYGYKAEDVIIWYVRTQYLSLKGLPASYNIHSSPYN